MSLELSGNLYAVCAHLGTTAMTSQLLTWQVPGSCTQHCALKSHGSTGVWWTSDVDGTCVGAAIIGGFTTQHQPATVPCIDATPIALAGVQGAVGASASSSPQPKDFVATIDATEGSPCFGQVISEADVPTSGNEPHHVGMNQDNTVSSQQRPSWQLQAGGVPAGAPAYLRACAGTLLCRIAFAHAG
jgi:hypothetical protein